MIVWDPATSAWEELAQRFCSKLLCKGTGIELDLAGGKARAPHRRPGHDVFHGTHRPPPLTSCEAGNQSLPSELGFRDRKLEVHTNSCPSLGTLTEPDEPHLGGSLIGSSAERR